MKGNIGILMVIAVMCPSDSIAWGMPALTPAAGTAASAAPAPPETLDALIERLDTLSPFSASVAYEVSLAMTDEDVVYNLDIASSSAPADTRFGADYLIDWALERKGETYKGFIAYFDGHCYRYRDNRLQEYHSTGIPFRSFRPTEACRPTASLSTFCRGRSPASLERWRNPTISLSATNPPPAAAIAQSA